MAKNCAKKIENKIIKNTEYPNLEKNSGNKLFSKKSPA